MKILVADDESIIRMGMRVMLEEMGHTPILARDGHDALQKAIKHNPDLAILDIRMPKTNGLQLAKALNKHNPLPIIFLTAYSQDDLIEQASELNVQGYLIKPVEPNALRATIAIAHKRFRDQEEAVAKRQQAEFQLAARKLIDRAKATLMAGGMNEAQAYLHIQQAARNGNCSMAQVAETILESDQHRHN
jgi:response regulator NasT